MQIYRNFLSEDLLERIESARTKSKNITNSKGTWEPLIQKDIKGSTHIIELYNDLIKDIRSFIDEKVELPEYNEFGCRYYIWDYHSGTNWHNDGTYAWGGTIYLMPRWEEEWGGLFEYEQSGPDSIKTVVPEYNMFILNTKKIMHKVTPVTRKARLPRNTLQIFCGLK